MAKGNDGNYLQHSIEVAAALRLAATNAEKRLHVAIAHGMAPFEPCDEPRPGQARGLLQRALNDSYRSADANEPPIVSAYRRTRASLRKYPNSAELLRATIGADRLSGGITEVDPEKYKQLADAWSGSRVVPVNASWRRQLSSDGILACPGGLETPWLFTADPMTFREDGYADDNNLYRADLDRLSAVLKPFVVSGKAGLAALFVYGVKPDLRSLFWIFVDDLASKIGASVMSCWVTHQGGNRNLAGLLCSRFGLSSDFLPIGVVARRE